MLRVVPRVERCEFVNAGAVVYSRSGDVLVAGVELDAVRALALDPRLDVTAVRRHLDVVATASAGTAKPMPVQASPVHTGLSLDPAGELGRLLDSMVRPLRD